MITSKETPAVSVDKSQTEPVMVYAVALFLLLGWFNLSAGSHFTHYAKLAESFLQGKLYFLSMPGESWGDTARFDGHYYWPLGPLPALIAVPFIWFGHWHQGQIAFLLSIGIFYFCFRLAQRFDYSNADACWLALAFCFGTSFVGVAAIPLSWYFGNIVTAFFLFWAINEHVGANRLWLIGFLLGLAMATRQSAGLNIIFFILSIIPGGAKDLGKLLVPFVLIGGLLALYNLLRFGSVFESGYTYQINWDELPYSEWTRPGNSTGPLFSLAHIPQNLWTFLLGLPNSPAGASVFLVSPYLLFLFPRCRWDLTGKLLAVNIVIVLFSILAFRSTGFNQMGYRLSLDFLPFVFFLIIRSRIKLGRAIKATILAATIVDWFLVGYFWGWVAGK
jgi:hypothetical protein